ncbi:MAG: cytochrome c family protein [SAR116 cluster bacterium]|jgi:cytochrome c|nr:cytochrome c family protein [SAR116 cluster bacterium]MBL6768668.1 cytochrome c family protein [Alphaproteobacteria bacterium]MDC0971234.1 cytochrome c family protein [Alphaproteobacteria bacterium]RCL80390.1 MAG: cytochrome c family protein [SAR116 cluster bacterium]CAI8382008.1 MAG: Cytochrome c-552 [SAR116 cluster bacterium]|tara:strand:+ start:662 stop:1240 length:579 start_codon:yes stop_codon:yes gene_type:complete
MDNLKTNKILAGFLLAGLLAMGGGKIAEILVPDQALDENAYPVEIKQVADSGQATTPVNQGPEPILALLASADIEAGIKVAKKCTACHEFDADGKNKTGPMLWNIVDASKGMKDGFNYSDALVGMGGAWDYEALNAFLYKPKAYIKGTKMNFAGLKKPSDRANMIAYLRSLADTPVALPTEAEIDAQEVSIQ